MRRFAAASATTLLLLMFAAVFVGCGDEPATTGDGDSARTPSIAPRVRDDGATETPRVPDAIELVWSHTISGTTFVEPTIVGQIVVAATLDGRLAAFDLETGAALWERHQHAPVFALSAIDGERLLVGSGTGISLLRVVADRAPIEPFWQRALGPVVGVTVAEGRCALITADGRVISVELDTGRALLDVETEGATSLAPLIAGDLIHVAHEDGVRLRVDSDAEVRREEDQPVRAWFVAGSSLAVASGDRVHVEEASGDLLWQWRADTDVVSIARSGDAVIVLTEHPAVSVIENGRLLAQIDLSQWSGRGEHTHVATNAKGDAIAVAALSQTLVVFSIDGGQILSRDLPLVRVGSAAVESVGSDADGLAVVVAGEGGICRVEVSFTP